MVVQGGFDVIDRDAAAADEGVFHDGKSPLQCFQDSFHDFLLHGFLQIGMHGNGDGPVAVLHRIGIGLSVCLQCPEHR